MRSLVGIDVHCVNVCVCFEANKYSSSSSRRAQNRTTQLAVVLVDDQCGVGPRRRVGGAHPQIFFRTVYGEGMLTSRINNVMSTRVL